MTARAQQRGAELAWTPDTKILLTLASDGPASREAVVGTVARLPHHAVEVDAAFDRLCNTGSVEPAGTGLEPVEAGHVDVEDEQARLEPERRRSASSPSAATATR